MNKKLITIIVLLFIIIGGLFSFSSSRGYLLEISGYDKRIPVRETSGSVNKITESSIFIESNLGGKARNIEFVVTPETVFKKSVLTITEEQIKSGKQFAPQTIISTGNISDISLKMKIIQVKTESNLLYRNKVKATEINYLIYDLPF